MASIPGGQYASFATGQPVNVVTTSDGSHLPPPIPGEFYLELVTSLSGPSALPVGYQGVARESADGKTIDLVTRDIALKVSGSGLHTITAGTGNDTIFGGRGPDLITGGSGRDGIFGGRGDDTIQRDSGPETIFGGAGRDLIIGGNGPDLIYGGSGGDTITAGSGPSTILDGNGGSFDDWFERLHDVEHGFDRFDSPGHAGDLITAGSGADLIYGGNGNDTIHGGSGPETIDGGSGHNQILLGNGPTLLQDSGFTGHDTVVGFDVAHGDRIGFEGENNQSIDKVVATASEHGANTTITLPDGSTMTLVGITHIDHTFFH